MIMTSRFLAIFAIFFICVRSSAVNLKANSAADDFSAKAFLEDIMTHRYEQALGTVIDREAFTVGVQMQLVDVAKKIEKKPEEAVNDTPIDLIVGNLDPEKLLQQYGMPDEKQALSGILSTKKIKFVQINVGLHERVGDATKAEVEKWLKTRITNEFGSSGRGEVTFLKNLPSKADSKYDEIEKPKNWIDWLHQFQQLAGVLLLAVAFLIGVLVWRFTTSNTSGSKSAADSPEIKLKMEGKGAGAGGYGESHVNSRSSVALDEQEERRKSMEELLILSNKLNTIVPKVTKDFEAIVRSWCQAGEEGRMKLVCFAEAVGKDVGRLPIPVDAMKDIAKIFSKMADINPREKIQALEKVYWDLVSVINLGAEVLSEPFGYLSGVDSTMISQVLIDQNPKMKTLVSLYLPDDVRKKYLKPMSNEQKLELLENAANLNQIASDELKTMDESIMKKVKAEGPANDSVILGMTLEKIVSSLNILEEIELLAKVVSPGISEFKRKVPSLAFIGQWPEEKFSLMVARISTDQAVALLRVMPQLQDKVINLSPPMAAEVIADEIKQADKLGEESKRALLQSVSDVLKTMVAQREIDLAEVFPKQDSSKDSNVIDIKTA